MTIEDGVVTKAWTEAAMFRGFEIILRGKDPQAGLIVTPRICAVRSYPGIQQSPSLEGTTEGDLVGILQAATDRQTGGRVAGDPQTQGPQEPRKVRGGGLALEVRVGRDDHLGDLAGGQPGHQLGEPQVVGADAFDEADGAAEHVVAAAELAGALDGHDVLGLLDDTEQAVSRRGSGQIRHSSSWATLPQVSAEADPGLDLGERVDQALHVDRGRTGAGGRRSAGRSWGRPRATARARR